MALTGSNRRHPACKADALPTEPSTCARWFEAARDSTANHGRISNFSTQAERMRAEQEHSAPSHQWVTTFVAVALPSPASVPLAADTGLATPTACFLECMLVERLIQRTGNDLRAGSDVIGNLGEILTFLPGSAYDSPPRTAASSFSLSPIVSIAAQRDLRRHGDIAAPGYRYHRETPGRNADTGRGTILGVSRPARARGCHASRTAAASDAEIQRTHGRTRSLRTDPFP